MDLSVNGNAFITNDKTQANDRGLSIARDRQTEMALDMIHDDTNAANSNGNIAAGSAIFGGTGAALSIGGLLVGGPLGFVIGTAVAAFSGAVGTGIFAKQSADDSTALNQDKNLYRNATGKDYGSINLGFAGNLAGKNAVNDPNCIPSDVKRAQYAGNLEGGKDYRAVSLYNPDIVDGQMDYAQLHDIRIDSAKFTNEQDSLGNYNGYHETVITTDKEYGDVMSTFLGTFDGNLSDENIDRLTQIASAMSTTTNFEDDKQFFDINGDGKLNNADIYALKYKTDKATQEEFDSIKDEDWDTWSSNEAFKKLGKQQDLIAKFDFDGDGSITNKDKELMLAQSSSNASPDINGDGKIDANDVKILESYMKANIAKYKRVSSEADALSNAMGGDNSKRYLAEIFGIEL